MFTILDTTSEMHKLFFFLTFRQSKPRNRPSFRQTLMHLDIASADVLATPQETYFKSQVSLEALPGPAKQTDRELSMRSSS